MGGPPPEPSRPGESGRREPRATPGRPALWRGPSRCTRGAPVLPTGDETHGQERRGLADSCAQAAAGTVLGVSGPAVLCVAFPRGLEVSGGVWPEVARWEAQRGAASAFPLSQPRPQAADSSGSRTGAAGRLRRATTPSAQRARPPHTPESPGRCVLGRKAAQKGGDCVPGTRAWGPAELAAGHALPFPRLLCQLREALLSLPHVSVPTRAGAVALCFRVCPLLCS